MLHPEPIHLAGELVAEVVEQILAQELLLEGFRTRASTSSRLTVRRLSHVPFSRAPKHARRFRPTMMNPAPQMPHFDNPENMYWGPPLCSPRSFFAFAHCDSIQGREEAGHLHAYWRLATRSRGDGKALLSKRFEAMTNEAEQALEEARSGLVQRVDRSGADGEECKELVPFQMQACRVLHQSCERFVSLRTHQGDGIGLDLAGVFVDDIAGIVKATASERDLVRRRRAPKRLHGSRLIRIQSP